MKSSVRILLALVLVVFSNLAHVSKAQAQDDYDDESENQMAIAPTPIPVPMASGEETYEDDTSDYNTDEEMDF